MAWIAGRVYITNRGLTLLSKVHAGASLVLLDFRAGDGTWGAAVDPADVVDLVHEVVAMPITSAVSRGNGLAEVSYLMTNEGLVEPMLVKEVGLYADDPDEGRILYAVMYADTLAQPLPTRENGGPIIEDHTAFEVQIGTATEVVANIDPGIMSTQAWVEDRLADLIPPAPYETQAVAAQVDVPLPGDWPVDPAMLRVVVNGLEQPPSAYTVDGGTVTLAEPLLAGDRVVLHRAAGLDLSRYNGGIATLRAGANRIGWAAFLPVAGTWARGDVVYNVGAATGQPAGWMCTLPGTPGEWRALPNLA